MPTVDEKNAAFNAVKRDIVEMERTMPGMFVGYVEQYVTTARILQMVNSALNAAEGFGQRRRRQPRRRAPLISSITIEFSTALKGSGKIRWLTRSQFSHCDIDVGYGLLGASDSPEAPCLRGNPRGVAVRPYAYQAFGRRHQAVIATPLAPYIIRKLETQLGKPFDHKALYAIFMPWMRDSSVLFDPAMWYCAEMVLWAFDGDHGPERKRFFPISSA